jgi:hypothetical protein
MAVHVIISSIDFASFARYDLLVINGRTAGHREFPKAIEVPIYHGNNPLLSMTAGKVRFHLA